MVRAQVDLATVRTRAQQGDPEAINALANAYANGQGAPQDLAEALRLYQQAADRGLAAALFNLGMMYELGRGVPADQAGAFKFYLKAAEQGFAPAQFNVGNMYANGLGVKQDFFEAALWFRQAAERRVPEAQYNLALGYELGRGVAKDDAAAQKWYRAAAAQGYARAQYNLALMLEEGRGSAANPAAAAEHYRAAAVQNFAPAQNNLGILLAEGRGAPANPVEAYAWLAVAVENGAKPTGRDLVAQQLSSAQLAEANVSVAKLRVQLGTRDAGSPQPQPTERAAAPAAVASAPLPAAAGSAPAAPSSEVNALNRRVAASEASLEKLLNENARLEGAIQVAQREKTTLEQRALAAESTAKAAAARPAPAGGDAAPVSALRAQVDQLTREAATLRAEKTDAQRKADELAAQLKTNRDSASSAAVSAASASSEASLQQLATSDSRIAKLISDNARLNDEVKRSTIEMSQVNRQLRTAQEKLVTVGQGASPTGPSNDEGKIADLTRQLTELRAANEKLVVEKSGAARPATGGDLQKITQQLAAVQADLARLQTENERLRQGAVAASGMTELQQRTTRAEQSLAETAKQRDALAAEKAALEKRLADGVAKPAIDPKQVQLLRTQLGEAADEIGAARRSAQEMRVELATAQQALAAAEKTAADAQAERDRLAARQRDVATAQAGATQARESLDAEVKAREALSAEKSSLERANAALRSRLEEITAERDKLAARPAATVDRDTLEKLNTQLEGAGRTIAELNARNESLQKDLEVSKQSVAAALAAQAAAAKAAPGDAMKLELQTLQDHVRTLETQLEEDRKNSARELSALAGQLQNAREANRALTEANRSLVQARGSDDASIKAEADQFNAKLKAAQNELEKSRAEQTRLAAELETHQRDLEGVRAAARAPAQERDTLRSQVEDMFGRLSEADRKLAQSKQAADAARAEAEKAQADFVALQARQSDADKAVERQGSNVAELTGLNEKLAGEKAALEKQLAQSRQVSELARTELGELRNRVSSSDKVAQEQLAAFNALGDSNEKLQSQLKELGGQVAVLRAENSRLTAAGESASAFRTELTELKAKLADAQKSGEQHGTTVAELTGANDKLAGELKELQSQLAALRSENTRLGQSDQARQEAEQRAANLSTAASQLAVAQRDLTAARGELSRLNETVQALDRDRTNRVTQLQQENTAITARLRQAQGTLDQIASAARLINGGAAPLPSAPALGSSAAPIMPASAAAAPAPPRVHVVAEGDSLTRISARYYGTNNRWQEIYDANREILKGENTLRPGQRLKIP